MTGSDVTEGDRTTVQRCPVGVPPSRMSDSGIDRRVGDAGSKNLSRSRAREEAHSE